MSLPAPAREALEAFAACPGWEQRARLLLQWGERLEPLDEDERNEANRVDGCDSLVWLVAEQRDGAWHFRAASEARVIRGLLAVLLARVDGLDARALVALDLPAWFDQLGLARQLSPSRANGLNAVLKRMAALAGR
ncbi:SufE family protein [Pseudomonas subflava]|uniref:SufE family protein n=1 Tax=Pseudomonas subflava TaxID=2952933 RepID=UPI0020792CF3|nr:SufE family protein [Pseudomonas subflava]